MPKIPLLERRTGGAPEGDQGVARGPGGPPHLQPVAFAKLPQLSSRAAIC